MDKFLTLTVDGTTHTDIVPQNLPMDPETEDIVYGNELEDGMLVLAVPHGRCSAEFTATHNPEVFYRVLSDNRWCKVSKIRKDDEERMVHFIGVYEDDQKVVRSSPPNAGWVVKRDSIPKKTGDLTYVGPWEKEDAFANKVDEVLTDLDFPLKKYTPTLGGQDVHGKYQMVRKTMDELPPNHNFR